MLNTVKIRQAGSSESGLVDSLCALLIDVVHDGASIGFLAPLTYQRAAQYWEQVFSSLGDSLVLWVAVSEGVVVGTIQLALVIKENGRHRAEIQKLMVLTEYRGQGISTRLMSAAESFARENGRTLLVLDTQAGSPAEAVYRHLGWQKSGEIPDYAGTPDGRLIATAYYYKILSP
jgi:GNAT superfamily N-acetyltransferase